MVISWFGEQNIISAKSTKGLGTPLGVMVTRSEALQLVNEVRDRVDADPLGSLTAEDLLAERGRELFFEGVRRQDLIRFGKFGEAWEFKATTDPCRELWPIPAAAISANADLDQNPCY